VRLILTAFGPFADTQTVDFRRVLDGRLFGIYGPTGSGKTSILDAICFALFGESSGDERQGADLRSHHASADVETEAQLVFELGPRRYHIVRRPAQTVAAKRGGGVTTRSHFAALYDATGMGLEEITPASPGAVLAERKVEAVADKLHELLGYKADQFRQVVLLPQGQFRKLLIARSDERAAVLRGLFDVSIYERFVARLKADAAALRAELSEGTARIEGRLGAHGAGDLEALNTLLETAREEHSAWQTEKQSAENLREAARAALKEAEHVEALFQEQDAAETAARTLEQRAANMEAVRSRTLNAAAAAGCMPAYLALSDARDLLARSQSEKTTCAEAAERARATLAITTSELAASNAQDAARQAAQARVTVVEGYAERLANAEPLRGTLFQAQTDLADADRALTAAKTLLGEARRSLATARTALQAAQAAQSDLAAARLSEATLLAEEKSTAEYEKQSAGLTGIETRLARARAEHITAQQNLQQIQAVEAEAESALAAAQAVHLARKLADGEPCPVCGSLEHPAPANRDVAGEGLDQAWRQAREGRHGAETVERAAAALHNNLEGERRQADEALARLSQPTRTSSAIAAEKTGLLARIADLAPGFDLAAAQARLQTAESGEAKIDAEVERRTASQSIAAAARDTASGALAGALADLPETLRVPEAANTELMRAWGKRDAMLAAHSAALATERTASQNCATAEANLASARARAQERARAVESAQAAFDNALLEARLTPEVYARAQPDIPSLPALQSQVSEFDRNRASAADRLSRAMFAIGNRSRPDIPALTEAATNADALVSGLDQALATKGRDIVALESSSRDVAAIHTKIEAAKVIYGRVGELCALADGANAQRLRLRDYAISATFEAVLEAANQRFSRMSRNRFTLLRKQEVTDGRARSGLEIAVHDTHTDQQRDAHTLSGGEGFLASLSLALGLSDVVQAEAGGVKLDTIFIDEGFGHLDDETLDIALDALRDLVGHERAVGVISHVDAVKQQIPLGFDLTSSLRGSAVVERLAA
jgi:exonuclease SbcC